MIPQPPSRPVPARPASPVAILGIPFDPVTTDQTVGLVAEMIESRQPHYLVTANVDFVVQADQDPELRRILFHAHLVLCDGMPLVWASRVLGNPLPERVTGSDMVPRLLAEAEKRNWRVFFLGGTEESVGKAAVRTLERHPKLRLVGAYSPPFKPLHEMDHGDILRRVTEARPDLLFVAFGCPKQEKWINWYFRPLGVPVSIGVGATIDFLAGTFRRAPVWMQRTGTEWLFRLLQEPRRLAQRYGKGFWIFGRGIFAQWRELRHRPRRAAAGTTPAAGISPAAAPGQAAPAPAATRDAGTRAPARADGAQVPAAPARLDAAAAGELNDAWLGVVENAPAIVDLGGTQFIDSTGVGLLVRLQKRATQRGKRLALRRVSGPVAKALALMRIESFFQREETADAGTPGTLIESISQGDLPGTGAVALAWKGELTAEAINGVAGDAEEHIAGLGPGSRVSVDLSRVTFVDSAGIGMMVRIKKRAWQRDVQVTYRDPGDLVRRVLHTARLEAYLLGTGS